MQTIYVLNTCDAHKTHASARPLFYFTDSEADKRKVLDFIKNDLDRFFDGEDETENKQRFNAFKHFIEYKQGKLNEALNGDTMIYASCTELSHIKNI